MRRILKKTLALLCILAMLAPASAYAAADGTGNAPDKPSADDDTGESVSYEYLEFGSYPQREVVAEAAGSGVYGKAWASEDDYIIDEELYSTLAGLAETEWDAHGDATVEGVKYRRIRSGDTACHTSGDAGAYDWTSSDTYHYFKYEAIRWRILSQNGEDLFLLSELVLDDQKYNTDITGDLTWESSTVRSWLNGYDSSRNACGTDYSGSGFLDTAFTEEEQARIISTALENADNIKSGTEGGIITNDKVFLLSESEVYGEQAAAYGFASSYQTSSTARQGKSSTYAKAMGTAADTASATLGNSSWWLRSPGSYPGLFTFIACGGRVDRGGQHANSKSSGIRPALHIVSSSSAAQAPVFSYCYPEGEDTGIYYVGSYEELLPKLSEGVFVNVLADFGTEGTEYSISQDDSVWNLNGFALTGNYEVTGGNIALTNGSISSLSVAENASVTVSLEAPFTTGTLENSGTVTVSASGAGGNRYVLSESSGELGSFGTVQLSDISDAAPYMLKTSESSLLALRYAASCPVGGNAVYYETLAEAWESVEESGTLYLLKDQALSAPLVNQKSFTLDLGGYDLSGETAVTVENQGGTLVITDSSAGEAGILDASVSFQVTGGQLTFLSGRVYSGLSASGSGVILISGGSFEENPAQYIGSDCAISQETARSLFEVVSGTEAASAAASVNGIKYIQLKVAVNNADGKSVTLLQSLTDTAVTVSSGKTVTVDLNGMSLANESGSVFENSGTLTLKGSGSVSGQYAVDAKAGSTTYIEGGDYTGSTADICQADGAAVLISGGTFSSPVPEERCAEGFRPVAAAEEGRYTVTDESEGGETVSIVLRSSVNGEAGLALLQGGGSCRVGSSTVLTAQELTGLLFKGWKLKDSEEETYFRDGEGLFTYTFTVPAADSGVLEYVAVYETDPEAEAALVTLKVPAGVCTVTAGGELCTLTACEGAEEGYVYAQVPCYSAVTLSWQGTFENIYWMLKTPSEESALIASGSGDYSFTILRDAKFTVRERTD